MADLWTATLWDVDMPIGTIVLFTEKNPLPIGWIPTDGYVDIDNVDGDKVIAIQKVDNLTYIEHLAKQRGLVV
jgi:hypothetical protein